MQNVNYRLLSLGGVVSLVALLVFAVGRTQGWSFLELETRWLLVAGVPLLVGLVAGGFIRSFKGFGIEIEAGLNEPVPEAAMERGGELGVQAADLAEEAEGVMKGSFERVHALSEAQRQEIRRLGFVMGPRAFYDEGILGEYFSSLPNLRYLEIKDPGGTLLFVVDRDGLPDERRSDFVQALHNQSVEQEFAPWVIRDFISPADKLLLVVKKFRACEAKALPVVVQGQIIGSLDRNEVFERLADLILRPQRT